MNKEDAKKIKHTISQHFFGWVFENCLSKIKWSLREFSDGISIYRKDSENISLIVKIKNKNIPERYDRVELMRMLEIIRIQEKEMGWKVPEPKLSEV